MNSVTSFHFSDYLTIYPASWFGKSHILSDENHPGKISHKNEIDAKKIAFSVANSPLVKTAIAGEDPNWGRIIMAIGKAGPKINLKKLLIKFGNLKIVQDGKLHQGYDETKASEYMKNEILILILKFYWKEKLYCLHNGFYKKIYWY